MLLVRCLLLRRLRLVLGQDILLDAADHRVGGRGVCRWLCRDKLQLRQRLQKGGLRLTQLVAAADEVRQLLLRHSQLLLGDLCFIGQPRHLLRRLRSGLRQHRVLFGLRLLHQLGGHLLGGQQRLTHGVLGGTVLLHLLRQYLQLGLQRDVFLKQGGIILRQRVQKLVHNTHAVAAAERRLGEYLLRNFLRCKHG